MHVHALIEKGTITSTPTTERTAKKGGPWVALIVAGIFEVGYAVWAGIGAIGAAVLGPVFFDETLTLVKAFWLAVIIGGVVWLKLSDSPKLAAKAQAAT